ncbi:MAG: phage major capsid protein [Lachnospiraceae bacterium]|nr:phage major capsid protein [Lachnospiraceae bacterium]
MADINRTTNNMVLPSEVSNEILQKTQEASAIMQLARRVTLPGRGLTIPVITGDPSAAWVAETAVKPHSNGTPATKLMQAYTIAVIETFSNQFRRDIPALYDAMVQRLPGALAKVFDATVVGAVQAPGNNFDTFANCTAQSILNANNGTYLGLVAADTDIATHGGILSGFAMSAQARGLLLTATDTTNRPLFLNGATEGAVNRVLGVPAYFGNGVYKAGTAAAGQTAGTPAIVGIAGDWSKALYGTVAGVQIAISEEATITGTANNTPYTINLWQQNMFAVRAEIEIGFRADTACFNLLTGAIPTT